MNGYIFATGETSYMQHRSRVVCGIHFVGCNDWLIVNSRQVNIISAIIMTKTIYHLGEKSACWWAFGLMFWFPKVKQNVYGCGRNCLLSSQRTTNSHFKGAVTNWALQHLVLYVQGMVHSFKTHPESQLNTCICKSPHNKQIPFSKGLDPHRRSSISFVSINLLVSM